MTDSAGEGERDLAAVSEALRLGWLLVERSELGFLELSGEDRVRFVNGMVTSDVPALAPGEGAYGFFTNVQGRILSDGVIQALPDSLRVGLPKVAMAAIAEHLTKYIIADRVEIRRLESATLLSLAGPGAAARLRELSGAAPEKPWEHRSMLVSGAEVSVAREPRYVVDVLDLMVSSEWSQAVAESVGGDTRPTSRQAAAAFEVLRVESGVPRFGRDFDIGHLPQETGVEGAVSFTKGCYLGQEVVARVHYLGEPSRLLRGLVLDSVDVPRLPSPLTLDGREVGSLTSAVSSSSLGRTLGLAVLKRRALQPGTRLRLADGSAAEVVELPFGEPPADREEH